MGELHVYCIVAVKADDIVVATPGKALTRHVDQPGPVQLSCFRHFVIVPTCRAYSLCVSTTIPSPHTRLLYLNKLSYNTQHAFYMENQAQETLAETSPPVGL
jgi:hypothetical protein